MKKSVNIAFIDFWTGWKPEDNYISNLLSRRYDVRISRNPDCVFYSVFTPRWIRRLPFLRRKPRCLRIFFTGENVRPPADCDYSLSFDYPEDAKNIRLPLYNFYGDMRSLLHGPDRDIDAIVASKTGFCNFVYSNLNAPERIRFFKKLSEYKKVDSGGRVLNNIGGPVGDKKAFLSRYKFTIAFENSRHPGYTTEKLIDPMLVESLPIYWGNPLVARDFNTRSFLSWDDYGSDEALIERVIEIDKDEELYRHYLAQPHFEGNVLSPYADDERHLQKLVEIFERHGIPK